MNSLFPVCEIDAADLQRPLNAPDDVDGSSCRPDHSTALSWFVSPGGVARFASRQRIDIDLLIRTDDQDRCTVRRQGLASERPVTFRE